MSQLSYLCVWALSLALLQTPGEAAETEQPKGDSAKSGRQLISLTKVAPILTPVSDYTGDIWQRSTLFGDVAGKRQQLYDAGVTFDVSLTQVVQSVVSGGADAGGASYNGLLDYGATFDTGKLGLWSGGLLVANAQTSFGNPLKTEPGNISPVNMTPIFPVPFENDTVLMEYYLTQGLPKNMVLTIGRIDAQNFLDKNRFGDDPRNQFLNTSLNNNLLLGEFISFSTYAALFEAPVMKNLSVAFAVADAETQPGDYGGVWDNVTLGGVVEYKWEFAGGLDGTITPHFLWTSKGADALDNPHFVPGLITGNVPTASGNWMVHIVFDQYLWKPKKPAGGTPKVRTRSFDYQEPGVGVFFRFGYVPEDRNPWNLTFSGGVGARGVIPGRPYDRMGFGVYTLIESNDVNNQPIIGRVLENEVGLEAFYNFAITPWLQITADFQWVDPGIAGTDDAVVLGSRIFMQF